MKVKVILRSMEEIMQEVFRNYDLALRPQEKVNPNHLKDIFSASIDGGEYEVRTVCQYPGRKGAVHVLRVSIDGSILISCGTDCIVRQWSVPITGVGESEDSSRDISEPLIVSAWKHKNKPVRFYVNFFRGADHQWNGNIFATAGAQVGIWDHNRSEPLNTFGWGNDTFVLVRFNPGEPNLLVTSASDRSIVTYDLRMSSPVRKLIMKVKKLVPDHFDCSSYLPDLGPWEIWFVPSHILQIIYLTICWCEANEDCNCYSYDARKLDEAKCVHQEHVSVVMDIDYSPTGREFVTGSYGRTVRIFQYNGGRNREIYHTKRMQSCDGTYLISGSDDTNLRLWKTKASEQPGVVLPRERKKQECLEAVVDRYNHLPEVNRIVRHRHLPKPIYKAANLRRTMIEADRTKEKRRKAHSAPRLSISAQPYRKRRIIREVE
ncbi:unnamed protein product [Spirodela intermedia]|uniref:Sof1-like protein domain-containing protein n=1 Tax=Spirodela intermedia TaxID=51605 RepID=A0A7I8L5X8_SPIIN|nr:unnamed protein product [Spirodela intermedia]